MIVIDQAACTGCGSCVKDCVAGNLCLEDGAAQAQGPCFLCGHCVAICPEGAVSNPYYQEQVVEYDSASFDVPVTNLVNSIKFRRSSREFTDQPVSMDQLRTLLVEAAGHEPTAVNRQQNRYFVVQENLAGFKELVWEGVRASLARPEEASPGITVPMSASPAASNAKAEVSIPDVSRETLERLVALKDAEPSVDFLFRNAPCVIAIDAADPLDGGLAAAAIELTAHAMGLGVLHNGYLKRIMDGLPQVDAFLDRDPGKTFAACLLIGRPAVLYRRTAPRRRPSIVLR